MIDRYNIIRRLDDNHFLVEDSNRRASLRVFRDIADRDAIARCFTEACLASAIDHPGIAPIHDVGCTADGDPFIVREHITAPTLATRLSRGPLPLRDALVITREIALVLASAHARGVAHGCLRPSAVHLVHGTVTLTGFGEAALEDIALYASPEQCRVARSYDTRSDLYALGCLLVEMIAGEPPFQSPRASEVRTSHLLAPPPSLRGPAAALIASLLAKRPEDRPTAPEVIAILAGLLARLDPEPVRHAVPWACAFALAITFVVSMAYDLRKEIDRISPDVFHELQRASLSR